MKISSIGQYITRQQRHLYISIISGIFFLTAVVLLFSTRYRLENTALENQYQVIRCMNQFFQTFQTRNEEYNQNQTIRNLLRYAADTIEGEPARIGSDFVLPSDVSLYVDGNLIYPADAESVLSATILRTVDTETLIYDDSLYYLVPYYNFTQSQQLGLLCYRILPRILADYCIRTIASQLRFCLYDSCGTIFYQTENSSEMLSDHSFFPEDSIFSGTIFIDARKEYKSNLLFLGILLIGCSTGVGLSIYFSKRVSERIVYPINQIILSLKHNQEGELTYMPTPPSNLRELNQISSAYEEMLYRIRHLVEQNHKQNLLKAESELKVLQERINPHFLFNTLELISSQAILEDADKTSLLAQKLGSLFRYSLRMPDIIYLRQEIQYAKDYLFLQNVRYNEMIQYRIDMPDTLSQFLIPKLTLQPILENCFKHGFADETDSRHQIQMTVCTVGNCIQMSVQDNGHGITTETAEKFNQTMALDQKDFSHFVKRGENIGLRNVNARLCSYYCIPVAVTLQPSQPSGTYVAITLPKVPADITDEGRISHV